MTRVLHVLGGLGTGGTECLIMNWYRNIDRTRVQFDFLVRSKDNNFVSEINELGGNIYYTSEFPKHILKNYKETKQVIKMAKWDIIHVHGNAAIYMTALVLAKRYNVPCRIMHSHSVQAKKNIYQYLHYFNRRFLHKFANIRLACSSKAGQWMFDDAHYQVLKNGVVLDQYRYNPSNRMRIRRELNLDKNFVVGHVGRFTEVKNHIFLLEIFKEIKKVKPDSVLLLVGEGELMAEIQSTATEMNISESVIFTGRRSDVGEIMSAMDVFAFPSIFEGLGNVIVEAQVSGLPCFVSSEVVTDEVKITESLQEISLQTEPSEWAKRILMEEIKECDRLLNIQKVQQSGYDIQEVVAELTNIYENATRGKRSE